ncbi:MAG TPA: class II aldolase/adducin family protein [Candidatus Krumholzibacteria bacterium]|nr:class II aldolase/adducin family protein [Candidatus Krumholzibacteria bacterium]HRX51721.1 class II aldolase/adducin family protein [Candidatus Krumholzibacteria bacterium]
MRAGRRLADRDLIVAAEGNLSVRLGGDLFLTTPAGREKGSLGLGDLVVVDLEGNPRGGRLRPSSEWRLHREIYRRRPDVGAVCHAHPPHALAFACARRPLPALMPEAVMVLEGEVPVAPYAAPGTDAVAESVRELIARRPCLLLANHGAVTTGRDMEQALHRMETLERVAQTALLADRLGGGVVLTAAEVRELRG